MVAYEFQRQGIGRKALKLAIEEIKSTGDELEVIEICYAPENTIAKTLYFSTGFFEVGTSDCGTESYAQIKL